MKEGWEYKKLEEICDFKSGFAFKSNKFTKIGEPIIRISDIQNGEVDDSNIVFFDPQSYTEDLSKYLVYPDDILIAMSGGTTGKIGINKSKRTYYLNQRVGVFRENKKHLNHKYLFYFLHTKSEESLRIAAGAAQPNLSTAQIKSFVIPVPSLSEQQFIVDYLDSAFAKIDAMKANAEKALNEAKALFQASLKEMLEPKEGWEEKTLKEVSVIYGNYGLSVPSTEYNGIRYLRITDITEWGELNDEKVSAKLDEEKEQELLEEGDILFARTGATVGKTLMYKEEFGDCLFAGYLIRYRLNKDLINPKFMFYVTHSDVYYKWVLDNQKAAAQPNISAKLYNNYKVSFPSLSEQQSIVVTLDSLKSKVDKLQENFDKTSQECDALKQAILRQVFE